MNAYHCIWGDGKMKFEKENDKLIWLECVECGQPYIYDKETGELTTNIGSVKY